MEIVVSVLLMSNFCFAVAVLYHMRRGEQKKSELEAQKRESTRKFYEARVLQEISGKIGYSLNTKSVAETIVTSFENLFQLSTITYALVENHRIMLTTVLKEAVGDKYVQRINTTALTALNTVDESTKGYPVGVQTVKAKDIKSYSALHFDPSPESYITIPLVVNNSCYGVITISSKAKNAFSSEDMDMIFRVVAQADTAMEKLESLIQSESSRLINLVSSLPTPAILFVRENNSYKVSSANPIATQVLKLPANPSFDDLIWSMEGKIDLQKMISDVYSGGISVFLRDVLIKNRSYKVYINPVYTGTQNMVAGVTLSMLDVTLETESEKMREKFTNMVVHELRAPMTSIKGGANLLLKGNLAPEDNEKMLHIISDSSERMLNQINDLLDAAKLESGKFAIAPARANINEIAQQRADSFSYLASTKQIKIETALDTAIPEFVFDKMRVDQVITNLLSNSLKFTQASGVITVKTEQKDGMVVVSVADNGMGVPTGKMNMLFVPFSQMQSAFRRDGTGLGLYISRGIIESHGGKIWMESQEGKGTTVSFSLPLNLKSVEEIALPNPVPLVPSGQKIAN